MYEVHAGGGRGRGGRQVVVREGVVPRLRVHFAAGGGPAWGCRDKGGFAEAAAHGGVAGGRGGHGRCGGVALDDPLVLAAALRLIVPFFFSARAGVAEPTATTNKNNTSVKNHINGDRRSRALTHCRALFCRWDLFAIRGLMSPCSWST